MQIVGFPMRRLKLALMTSLYKMKVSFVNTKFTLQIEITDQINYPGSSKISKQNITNYQNRSSIKWCMFQAPFKNVSLQNVSLKFHFSRVIPASFAFTSIDLITRAQEILISKSVQPSDDVIGDIRTCMVIVDT